MTPIPFIAVVALLTAGGLEEYGLPAVAPVAADAPVAAVAAPEARPYDETADASEAVAAAMTRAALADKRVIVVMGANWCHDSRALAGWFATPRFAAMLDSRYEVVFVDAVPDVVATGRRVFERFQNFATCHLVRATHGIESFPLCWLCEN